MEGFCHSEAAGEKTAILFSSRLAIASRADIKSVQDILGHATASFTLNVYAHTSKRMMKDTAARVQSYYDSLAQKSKNFP